jgi:hypothetical protein
MRDALMVAETDYKYGSRDRLQRRQILQKMSKFVAKIDLLKFLILLKPDRVLLWFLSSENIKLLFYSPLNIC